MPSPKLLIIWHSRTGTAEALAAAAAEGAGDAGLLKPARDVEPQDLLDASGYLFAVSAYHVNGAAADRAEAK